MRLKSLIYCGVMTLIVACTNANKIELPKSYDLNWVEFEKNLNLDIKYIQLNFNPFLDEEIMGKSIEDLMFKDSVYTLDKIDKERLSSIISDSVNFTYGECGTFALNAGFVFIENDTIKGTIQLGCGYADWGFEPGNINSLDGSLSDIGFEKMTTMLDDINKKMNKRTHNTN